MPAAPLLPPDEIARRLERLPDWRLQDARLVRTLKRRDFRGALRLVERIADAADDQNHHPDVMIHWDTVTLTLWTHASGGITERDFRLAEAIERIASEGS